MAIDFSQTTAEICDKCENSSFIQIYKIRTLSALLSPTGTEAKIPIPLFACNKCDHVNKSMYPKEQIFDDEGLEEGKSMSLDI